MDSDDREMMRFIAACFAMSGELAAQRSSEGRYRESDSEGLAHLSCRRADALIAELEHSEPKEIPEDERMA